MESPSVVVPVSGLKATYPPSSAGVSTAVSSIGSGEMASVWGCSDQFGWSATDPITPRRRSNGRRWRKGLGHALQFGLTAPMVVSSALAWLWIVHLGGYSTLFGVASLLIAASLVPLRALRR